MRPNGNGLQRRPGGNRFDVQRSYPGLPWLAVLGPSASTRLRWYGASTGASIGRSMACSTGGHRINPSADLRQARLDCQTGLGIRVA